MADVARAVLEAFLRLPGSSESLLASAYVRAQALVHPEDIITVTSQDFAFFVKDTFQEVIGKVPSMERVKDLHRSDIAGVSTRRTTSVGKRE